MAQSPLCGLARVLVNEHPELRCRMVDLGASRWAGESPRWSGNCGWTTRRRRSLCAAKRRYRATAVRKPWSSFGASRTGAATAEKAAMALNLLRPGLLENLAWRAARRRAPGPGEVEIQVAAAALDFRDVMKALGMLPTEADDALVMGDECAGRVVSVGKDVSGLREGDEVIALGNGYFASHVTTSSTFVLPRPPHLSPEEAATVPVCCLTAQYVARSTSAGSPRASGC